MNAGLIRISAVAVTSVFFGLWRENAWAALTLFGILLLMWEFAADSGDFDE